MVFFAHGGACRHTTDTASWQVESTHDGLWIEPKMSYGGLGVGKNEHSEGLSLLDSITKSK